MSQAIPTTPVFMGLQALLNFAGLSLGLAQVVSYSIWFTTMGFSFYYFMLTLYGANDHTHSIVRMSGVMFYMFNFYQLFLWTSFYVGQGFEAIVLPAFMGILIRCIRARRVTPRAALGTFLISVVISPVGEHPPSYVAAFFVFIALIGSFVVLNGLQKEWRRILTTLRVFGTLTLVVISANMFWLLASLNFIVSSSYLNAEYTKQVFSVSELLGYTSSVSSLLNVIRLQGNIDWFAGWGGQPYATWFNQYLTNPLLIAGSLMLPLLAMSAIMLSRRNKYVQFFSILTLISLFLSLGIHQPGLIIYTWLITNVPGFWILRAPWSDYTGITIVGYSVLAAIACGEIFRFFSRRVSLQRRPETLRRILPFMLISIILACNIAYNYPFVTGQMIPGSEGDFGYHQYYNVGYPVNIPSYIFQATDWFNNLPSGTKVAVLPPSSANVYQWGRGAAGDVTFDLFTRGVLSGQFGQGTAAPNELQAEYALVTSALNDGASSNLGRVLGLMDVGHILERNDFAYNFYGPSIDSPQFIKHQLAAQDGISLQQSFGSWDFYSNRYALPVVYASTNVVIDNGTLEGDFVQDASLLNVSELNYTALFFANQQPGALPQVRNLSQSNILSISNTTNLPTLDGNSQPFSWSNISATVSIQSRNYVGAHKVISTNGAGNPDMLVFSSPSECPYVFPTTPDWSSSNSTLIFIQTGNSPISISSIATDGRPPSDIIGVWWQTGWMGMGTNAISFPIIIPANQRLIIQVNHFSKNVQLTLQKLFRTAGAASSGYRRPQVGFTQLNPTEFKVSINNATAPFLLILSEPYESQWTAYYGSGNWLSYPFTKSVSTLNHIIINGFANGWYIDKTGSFDLTLYYTPQSLVNLGSTVTIASGIVFATIFALDWSRRRNSGVKLR